MADAQKPDADIARSRQDKARKTELSRQADARAARLATALKENLRKRKDQARRRRPGEAEEQERSAAEPLSPQSSGPSRG